MQVHAFSYTNLVIQKLLLSQWTFSRSKYSFLSPQKLRDGYVLSIHIIVKHIGNNHFNIIFPSTAQFNMCPPLLEVFNLWHSWSLILASTSVFCKEKILLLCTVISYDYYTDIYHDNEHLIVTCCTLSEIHSTCYVNFYLKQCKLWDCNSYCHTSNPLALQFIVQCTAKDRDLNGLNVDYTLITNLMHWLLFIHKILFSSTCFEHQVLIFRST